MIGGRFLVSLREVPNSERILARRSLIKESYQKGIWFAERHATVLGVYNKLRQFALEISQRTQIKPTRRKIEERGNRTARDRTFHS